MKSFIYLLPLAMCPLSAQVADAESACMAALDVVKNSQSENLGPVITAVMEATGGDERAYHKLMKKAADAGHPVALTWLARQSLQQLRSQGGNLETAPEAIRLRAVMEQAASQGYIPAVVEMAHYCGSGVGAPADEQSGMNLFDSSEIQSAISTVNEEKAKLEKVHQELWSIFDGIDRNESSANVWQERLREYNVRKDFYEKLSAFAKMVDFLYSSYELFELVGFEQAEIYRKNYLFFKKLKDSGRIYREGSDRDGVWRMP